MYRCAVCDVVTPAGQPRLVYCVYREQEGKRQIDRELSVCPQCKGALDAGHDFYRLRTLRQQQSSATEACAVDETGASPKIVSIKVKGPLDNPVIFTKLPLKRVF